MQISDIHVGPTIKKHYVQAIVDAVNGLLPDVIAVTGDVVDGSVEHLAAQASPLSTLRAPFGVYLVTAVTTNIIQAPRPGWRSSAAWGCAC